MERGGAAEGQLEGLLGTFATFEPGNPSSPVAPVGSVLVDLDAKLDIDTTGLSTNLSATIEVIKNALPPGTLEYVEAIEDAYDSARALLHETGCPATSATEPGRPRTFPSATARSI